MSDLMLHGVLNMPPDLWTDSPTQVSQRFDRYQQASELIKSQAKKIEELEMALIENYHYGTLERRDIERLIPKLKEQGK